MDFIQEKIIIIQLNLTKTYKLIQFDDVHVSTFSHKDSAAIKKRALKREEEWVRDRKYFADRFHDFYDANHPLSSTECLNQLIDYTNREKPDAVLLTGDLIDYDSEANHQFLKKSLKAIQSPYLFSCGNHETPASLYNDICHGRPESDSIIFDELVLVSLDNSARIFTQKQIDALLELLKLSKPVLISMHIPLVTMYNEPEMNSLESYYTINHQTCDIITRKMIDLMSTNPLIKAIFCGHIHGYLKTNIAPNKPQYCCSSGLIGSVNKIMIY